jgi:hypothetical protein
MVLEVSVYRQVPRKPRLVGGDESAQSKNKKINFRDAPRCARRASQEVLL